MLCISLFPMSMSTVYVCIQVQYLQDFSERLELNIWYNTEIKEVTRPPPSEEYEEWVPFHLEDQNQILYLCDVLIVRCGDYLLLLMCIYIVYTSHIIHLLLPSPTPL